MTNDQVSKTFMDGLFGLMFGGQFHPVPPPIPPGVPEPPKEDVLEKLHRQIAESAKHHSDAIRRDHERSLKKMHRRHDFRLRPLLTGFMTLGETVRANGSAVPLGISSSATFSMYHHVRVLDQDLFRIPSGKANPTIDDFYINVPLILKLWFRQTTSGRIIQSVLTALKGTK